jgi:hypothetical protein
MLTRGGTNDCFGESSAEQNQVGLFEQLEWLEKRTSVAKAVKRRPFYGTVENHLTPWFSSPWVSRRLMGTRLKPCPSYRDAFSSSFFWPLQRGSSLYRMCRRKS